MFRAPAVVLLVALCAAAQDVPRLTNKEVVELVQAGISSATVIAKINASRCNFDTEPSVLAELKRRGVPDDVLKAMIEAPYGPPKAPPAPAAEKKQALPPPQPERQAAGPAPAEEQAGPMPDRWRGLVIDRSTPADAVKRLGHPKKDRVGGLRTYPLNERLTVDHNTEGLRKLRYENVEGVGDAELIFKDERLVIIELRLDKSVKAGSLARIYDADFDAKFSGMDQAFSPRNYERHKGKVYPKEYPTVYYLVAVTEKTYISAMVENGPSLGSMLAGSRRDQIGEGDDAGYPGKTKIIQIISRTLENRTGAGALK